MNDFIFFMVSAVAGLGAILFGLFWRRNNKFWTIIKSGFLIGGLASLFIGTGMYYDEMGRFVKPIVIFLELAIVILVTYRINRK
jgi:hypothetical protein